MLCDFVRGLVGVVFVGVVFILRFVVLLLLFFPPFRFFIFCFLFLFVCAVHVRRVTHDHLFSFPRPYCALDLIVPSLLSCPRLYAVDLMSPPLLRPRPYYVCPLPLPYYALTFIIPSPLL